MELPVKILGIIAILLAATLAGFFKSFELRQRYRKLTFLHGAMSELRERIRSGTGEINKLVRLCFKEEIVKTNNGFKVNENWLTQQDVSFFSEFLDNLGMSESDAECKRIGIYMALLLSRCDEAEKKCSELCRLYATSGFLCGVFICILFL